MKYWILEDLSSERPSALQTKGKELAPPKIKWDNSLFQIKVGCLISTMRFKKALLLLNHPTYHGLLARQ